MKYCILLLLLTVGLYGQAQKVKVTKMNRDYFRHTNVEGFHYLHEDASNEMFTWIADITVQFDTIKPVTLTDLFNKMNEKGNKLGANAFRVAKSDIYTPGDRKYIKLRIFYLKKESRDKNLALFQRNSIYMFGFLGHHKDIKGYKIALNSEKMILEELRYKVLDPSTGSLVKLKLRSGLKSDEVKTKIDVGMLPRYYKFEVFKGLFSGVVISEYEWSFAEMLIRILKKEVVRA